MLYVERPHLLTFFETPAFRAPLRAWVHYVPVHEDLSDLVPKVQNHLSITNAFLCYMLTNSGRLAQARWIQTHPEESSLIAARALRCDGYSGVRHSFRFPLIRSIFASCCRQLCPLLPYRVFRTTPHCSQGLGGCGMCKPLLERGQRCVPLIAARLAQLHRTSVDPPLPVDFSTPHSLDLL